MASVLPIFDEEDSFIGLWAQHRKATYSLHDLGELMSLAEPTHRALTRGRFTTHVHSGVARAGPGVQFRDGQFLMAEGEPPPHQQYAAGAIFRARSHHGIPILVREVVARSGREPEGLSRGHVPCTPYEDWRRWVFEEPWVTRTGVVGVDELGSKLEDLTMHLAGRVAGSRSAQNVQALLDDYLGVVCLSCLGGVTVERLRSLARQGPAAPASDSLLRGRCWSCGFDQYGFVWRGHSRSWEFWPEAR